MERVLRDPQDTAATPEPNALQRLLVPGPFQNGRWIGDSLGVTRVEADIGAPVNERISIPVYTTGKRKSVAPRFHQGTKITVTDLPANQATTQFDAKIAYEDPLASTYGIAKILFTEVPWPRGTGGFVQSYPTARVSISPRPYSAPPVDWTIDGDNVNVQRSQAPGDSTLVLQGTHPGVTTLHANLGVPINRVLSIPVITYPTLVLPCRNGVHFASSGALEFTTDRQRSDLFLDCDALRVPGGGVMLTNGNDPKRQPPRGAIRGPQFSELNGSAWTNAFTVLTPERYDDAIEPCNVPESPNVVKIDYSCTTMSARTLLFRTRDGRYAKWLIQIGNGFSVLAGPYQVL